MILTLVSPPTDSAAFPVLFGLTLRSVSGEVARTAGALPLLFSALGDLLDLPHAALVRRARVTRV